MSEPEVLIRLEGAVGRITLNRPQALHALTTNMCRLITDALVTWIDNPIVALVMFDHSGERGFCAGGDIRMLAESGAGDGKLAREFFFTEYRMNELLFRYPKPTLAVMDGITMGGGVGLSMPCLYRVATERMTFAMPETGIGLFPDVGGGWYLSRMPDHLGVWLALTGARIKAADCKLVGVATDVVPGGDLDLFKAAVLNSPAAVQEVLAVFDVDPGEAPLALRRREVAAAFSVGSVEALFADLEAGTAWSREQLQILRTKSPQALKVTLRQLQLAAEAASFADNMAMEYRIAVRVVQRPDFIEGVRAVIVDRDNRPTWSPPSLAWVNGAMLAAVFAPLPPHEEWTPMRELAA